MPAHPQSWSSETYRKNASFVADLGADVLGWLAPCAGERILDLGCGDGALTEKLLQAGAEVIGIDTSKELLAAALARGIDARLISAEALAFNDEFDAVFSNAAMHWMLDQDRVIAGVAAALRPGGRFVAEFGGHGNVAAIVTALGAIADKYQLDPELARPWIFPTADEHAARLQKHGLRVQRIALIPRPTPLPTGMSGWLATFRQPFFDQLPPELRAKALGETCELLRWSLCDSQGGWSADYVRLRFAAVKI